jgi:hypothetical protein
MRAAPLISRTQPSTLVVNKSAVADQLFPVCRPPLARGSKSFECIDHWSSLRVTMIRRAARDDALLARRVLAIHPRPWGSFSREIPQRVRRFAMSFVAGDGRIRRCGSLLWQCARLSSGSLTGAGGVVTMTKKLDHQALVDFTRRWFALWTEADPQSRSKQVADLWAPAGAQVLVDPPQAMRDAAIELAFPVPRLEVRGHDEIDRRVTRAYEMFIEPGEYTFTAAGSDAVLLAPGLVGLAWDMVTVADGTVAGSGYDVLVLDDDARILLDHQHILG